MTGPPPPHKTTEAALPQVRPAPRPIAWLLNGLGWICVAIGAVGLVLPGLPTTVFLLIALWAFGRGSPRFHAWLYRHPRLGPPLVAWREHGVVGRGAKITALLVMSLSFAAVVYSGAPPAAIWATGVVLIAVAGFLLSRPSHPSPITREAAGQQPNRKI